MNVLLLSMPDSFEHMPSVADPHAERRARVARRQRRSAPSRRGRRPDPRAGPRARRPSSACCAEHRARRRRAVGDDVPAAHGAAPDRARSRALRPSAAHRRRRLRSEPRAGRLRGPLGVDFIVRGEGEITFRELLRALERGGGFDGDRRPLATATATAFRHTPDRPVSSLDEAAIAPPNRAARVLAGYTLLGRPVDVIETSRGCTFDCSFCSIIEMRGRNFHTYDFDRVLDDIRDCARPRRPRPLHRRRQHHARREALRRAVPGDRRRRAARPRLHRSRR